MYLYGKGKKKKTLEEHTHLNYAKQVWNKVEASWVFTDIFRNYLKQQNNCKSQVHISLPIAAQNS